MQSMCYLQKIYYINIKRKGTELLSRSLQARPRPRDDGRPLVSRRLPASSKPGLNQSCSLIGDQHDREFAREISKKLGGDVVDLVGKTTLRQTAALLRRKHHVYRKLFWPPSPRSSKRLAEREISCHTPTRSLNPTTIHPLDLADGRCLTSFCSRNERHLHVTKRVRLISPTAFSGSQSTRLQKQLSICWRPRSSVSMFHDHGSGG